MKTTYNNRVAADGFKILAMMQRFSTTADHNRYPASVVIAIDPPTKYIATANAPPQPTEFMGGDRPSHSNAPY